MTKTPKDAREIQQHNLLKLRQKGENLQNLISKERSTWVPVFEWGKLRFNPATLDATYTAQPLDLTLKQCRLLQVFLQNSRIVLNGDEILKSLSQAERALQAETLKAHIKHLYVKLQAAGAIADVIETV